MKKVLYVFALGGLFAFASCDSPAEERADQVEDQAEDSAEAMEDRAEESADAMEDMEEEMDTTAVIE